VTATGRLSSSDPNLQNIPVRTAVGAQIRQCFTAEPGHTLVVADYSQIELRIMAHLSAEPTLLDSFVRGEDIHTRTAAEVFGLPEDGVGSTHRRYAKAVNFGIMYGISPFGLSQNLGIEREEAAAYIDRYFERMPMVKAFIEITIEVARRQGYVTTMFGRRRPIPELTSGNFQERSLGERLAVNSVIQGSAADIIKMATIGWDENSPVRVWSCRCTTNWCSRYPRIGRARRRPRLSRRWSLPSRWSRRSESTRGWGPTGCRPSDPGRPLFFPDASVY
jgi:DNA polymerase-1